MSILLYGTQPIGKAFEDSMGYLLKHLYGEDYLRATESQDQQEGTDFFIGSIRVDVTMRPVKNKVKYIDSFVIPGCTIHVQIRYGNKRHDFKEPVLLLYFESFIGHDPYDLVDLIEAECDKEFFDQILSLYRKHV
jgi:hypothetical protein